MGFFKLSQSELQRVYDAEEQNFNDSKKFALVMLVFFNLFGLFFFIPLITDIFQNFSISNLFSTLLTMCFLEGFFSLPAIIMYSSGKKELKKIKNMPVVYGIYGILKDREMTTSRYRSNGSTRTTHSYYFFIEIDGVVDRFKVDMKMYEEKQEGDKILLINLNPNAPLTPDNLKCY